MKRVQSTCNYCALDCNMDFYVEDGRIVKVLKNEGITKELLGQYMLGVDGEEDIDEAVNR